MNIGDAKSWIRVRFCDGWLGAGPIRLPQHVTAMVNVDSLLNSYPGRYPTCGVARTNLCFQRSRYLRTQEIISILAKCVCAIPSNSTMKRYIVFGSKLNFKCVHSQSHKTNVKIFSFQVTFVLYYSNYVSENFLDLFIFTKKFLKHLHEIKFQSPQGRDWNYVRKDDVSRMEPFWNIHMFLLWCHLKEQYLRSGAGFIISLSLILDQSPGISLRRKCIWIKAAGMNSIKAVCLKVSRYSQRSLDNTELVWKENLCGNGTQNGTILSG